MSSIHSDKGWLLISFMLNGKRVRLYLGLKDTRDNRRRAEIKEVRDLIQLRQWAALAARFPDCKHFAAFKPAFTEDSTTFGQASDRFLAHQANSNKKATVDFYSTILKTHLAGELAAKPLRLIGASDVMTIVGAVAHRGHQAQAANVRRVISAVFNWARGERGTDGEYLVTDNPVTRTRPVVVSRDEQDEVDPFTTDEVERIIKAARPGWERRLVTVAIETGLRVSENFGLKRSDVDLKAGIIRVRQTWSRFGEGTVKNKRSRRVVTLSSPARDALGDQIVEVELRSPWLWPSSPLRPQPRNPQRFSSKNWPAILKRAGVEHRSFYQCRHTFATRLLAQGREMQEIAGEMGHSDLKMLFDHYLKWRQDKAEESKARSMR